MSILQLQAQVEELRTDVNRERKLRERAEEYNQEIELEVETLKKQAGTQSSMASLELSQEISRFEQQQFYRFSISFRGYAELGQSSSSSF